MNIESMVKTACNSTKPFTRARSKALSGVKWRLRSGLLYAGLNERAGIILVEKSNAQVFDGRDNEQRKLAYYQAVSGYKFESEMDLCAS